MARSFTLNNLIDEDGLTVINAWCRAFQGDSHVLVEEQWTDSTGDADFVALPDAIDCYIVAMWGKNTRWFYTEAPPDLSELPGDLDDIADGGTYAKIEVAQLTANRITLSGTDGDLDDISDGSTYAKVLNTDITAGHVLLTECTGDIDDIGDGSTYAKVLATDISSGHIKLTSNTAVDGEWYNESGVEIDSTHGINIYGAANALTTRATKTGTIQCSLDSGGKLIFGGGECWMDATGAHFGCGSGLTYPMYIGRSTGGGGPGSIENEGKITVNVAGKLYIISAVSPLTFSPDAAVEGNFTPTTDSYSYLGDATHYWKKLYTDDIALDNDIVPKTDVTSILGDASHVFTTAYIDKVYRTSAIASSIGASDARYTYGYFAFLDASAGLVIPVKADTGDPTGAEGRIYANTYDNKIRCYADGAWRDLATW